MQKSKSVLALITTSPITWGVVLCLGFYGAIEADVVSHPLVTRYFASHPVAYVITMMFFVALANVMLKLLDTLRQQRTLDQELLPPIRGNGQSTEDAPALAEDVDAAAGVHGADWRPARTRRALELVAKNQSASTLSDELKYLAEEDAQRAHEDYGLVRMIIAAIPILGFLGTVIGIALALGNLSTNLEESMPVVKAGLTVAFDTTALALTLSLLLHFSQFLAHRKETALLAEVDRLVEEDLIGRFEDISPEGGRELEAVRRMIQELGQGIENLASQQSGIWRQSLEAVNEQWNRMADDSAETWKSALVEAMKESMEAHARELAMADQRYIDASRSHWHEVQETLLTRIEAVDHLQEHMIEQAEVLTRVVKATGKIAVLEDRLNQNLASLSEKGNFEEAIHSLSATIHLLNSRLRGAETSGSRVQLDKPDDQRGTAA